MKSVKSIVNVQGLGICFHCPLSSVVASGCWNIRSFFLSLGPTWKRVQFLSALSWKGPHIVCWPFPLAPGLRNITLKQGCWIHCLFLIPSLHSMLTEKQRKDYFSTMTPYSNVLLYNLIFVLCFFVFFFKFRVRNVKVRHRQCGILWLLSYWRNWLIVIPSALKSVDIYTNKAGTLMQN